MKRARTHRLPCVHALVVLDHLERTAPRCVESTPFEAIYQCVRIGHPDRDQPIFVRARGGRGNRHVAQVADEFCRRAHAAARRRISLAQPSFEQPE